MTLDTMSFYVCVPWATFICISSLLPFSEVSVNISQGCIRLLQKWLVIHHFLCFEIILSINNKSEPSERTPFCSFAVFNALIQVLSYKKRRNRSTYKVVWENMEFMFLRKIQPNLCNSELPHILLLSSRSSWSLDLLLYWTFYIQNARHLIFV